MPVPITPSAYVAQASPGAAPQARLPFGPEAQVKALLPPDSKTVKEPSGVAYHPERKTLFVVGDTGDVAELTPDGKVLHKERLGTRGFEGITVGPEGRLFAIEEKNPPKIHELDADSLAIKATHKVATKFEGKRVLANEHNRGTEGLSYVPELHAFYCVNQNPPRLVKLDVPLDEPKGKARIVEVIDLSGVVRHQASDLTYDTSSGHFLVTESSGGKGAGLVYELTREGQLVRKLPVPGRRAEGLALDDAGRAFIADDAGGVLRVGP